jgi:FtsP/CotA-like multicopper oxidase with cupredoxin domain
MRDNTYVKTSLRQLACLAASAIGLFVAYHANAAAPGITGGSAGTAGFNLRAAPAYMTQPDGTSIYSWGYGCNGAPTGFAPAGMPNANCPGMQIPGPTLIVTQGDIVTVTLTNNLPAAAGNTSILFPGFNVTTSGGTPGLLTGEAAVGGSVTYTFVADKAGTHSYYSGTQGDLQIEMGLYGAIIVLPKVTDIPSNCVGTSNDAARAATRTAGDGSTFVENDFRLAKAAFSHPATCYDREYLFQFSELDPVIHRQVEEQKQLACTKSAGCLNVATEPYHAVYFMINGRSMPDNMDPNYAVQYPHQPYNGNPHMHPGEVTLARIIGHGRLQHPFHEHGNHVRVLARDGNLLLSSSNITYPGAVSAPALAGPLLFTTTTTPGQAMDGLFYWTGKGLNWDVYAHGFAGDTSVCTPDANGYYTADPTAPNYYEWCGDHNKPLESKPFGSVGSGGPVTLPDPNIVANGPWYGGSPYLGPDAMVRAVGSTPIPPSGTVANSPTDEAGFAFMWHSHNEREITTNNIFPGGMLMMMLVDPRAFKIDESK